MREGGSFGVGTSPPGALAHLPCCHTNGDTIRVGLKRGEDLFLSSLKLSAMKDTRAIQQTSFFKNYTIGIIDLKSYIP